MIEPVAVELLLTLGRSMYRATPGQREAWLRDVETQFASALSPDARVEHPGRAAMPDIVVPRANLGSDLAVELKAIARATFRKNIGNRVSELMAQSVVFRRLFHGPVTIVAVLLLTDPPSLSVGRPQGLQQEELERVASTLLRNFDDGVGYDAVAIGSLDDEEGWSFFTAGTDEPLRSLDLSLLLDSVMKTETVAREFSHEVLQEESRQSGPTRFLLVADEWKSGHGGLSTLNRELAIALSQAGCQVSVVVPSADSLDRDDATANGVELASPSPLPGLTPMELLLSKPVFQGGDYRPDVIVGHGRRLGPFAFALQANFFPDAKRIHVVHTDAEQLESAKEQPGAPSNMMKADERRSLETQLAVSADLVVGVGPNLTADIGHQMRGVGTRTPPITELRPGLRDWGGAVDPNDPPRLPQVLVVGRAEDSYSKGLDIAARGVLSAFTRLGHTSDRSPFLVVRGVLEQDAPRLKSSLEGLLSPHVKFFLRPYVTDVAALRNDLWQSQVVLMPSRHEGFGLSAYEAIAAGVPVLISEESGLARLLSDMVGPSVAVPEALPVAGRDEDVIAAWGDAIFSCLNDPGAAFARADELRSKVENTYTWRRAADELMDAYLALS